MDFIEDFKKNLYSINEDNFLDCSLVAFDFQYHNNPIYKTYCNHLGKTPKNVTSLEEIPFLPIEFFKHHVIKSTDKQTVKLFKSSGTTSQVRSEHHITDLRFYHKVCKKIFESTFDKLDTYRIVALLPSYLEQGDSSLINMIDSFMKHSQMESGYFLNQEINEHLFQGQKSILFGVSYALLDFNEIQLTSDVIIIETGGMKGRRKEMTRLELHDALKRKFQLTEIWSEYGMTELHSQAYGKNGDFTFPSWATVMIREINDPFRYLEEENTGGINVVDLANIETCAFIETKDLGKVQNNKTFQVLGRFDSSEIRGCNLLI